MPVPYATLLTACLDNADYDETGSCTKARAFVSAVRGLMFLPKSAAHGAEEISFDQATLNVMLRDASAWVAEHCAAVVPADSGGTGAGGGAIHYDLGDYRE